MSEEEKVRRCLERQAKRTKWILMRGYMSDNEVILKRRKLDALNCLPDIK